MSQKTKEGSFSMKNGETYLYEEASDKMTEKMSIRCSNWEAILVEAKLKQVEKGIQCQDVKLISEDSSNVDQCMTRRGTCETRESCLILYMPCF